jgi:hypothetical protein
LISMSGLWEIPAGQCLMRYFPTEREDFTPSMEVNVKFRQIRWS